MKNSRLIVFISFFILVSNTLHAQNEEVKTDTLKGYALPSMAESYYGNGSEIAWSFEYEKENKIQMKTMMPDQIMAVGTALAAASFIGALLLDDLIESEAGQIVCAVIGPFVAGCIAVPFYVWAFRLNKKNKALVSTNDYLQKLSFNVVKFSDKQDYAKNMYGLGVSLNF